MTAHRTLALLLIAAAAVVAAPSKAAPTPAAAIPIHGPQLLVDNYLIATQHGVQRVIEQPRKEPAPIIDGANDHNYQPYLSVIHENGVFRLWYDAKLMPGEQLALGSTTSTDGLHFTHPPQMLPVPSGFQYGASIVKTSRGYLLPYFARARESSADNLKGLSFAWSPDGLDWTATTPDPKYLHAGDITSVTTWQGRYLLFTKEIGSGYQGTTPRMPYPGYRRLVGLMTSVDGDTWTTPAVIFAPDAADQGITEFYGMGGVINRGGLLIGFLRVLRDDLAANDGGPADGVGYTVLAWSHDGLHWQRDRQPFLDRGPTGAWDRAMAWADAQVVDNGRTIVYYGGYLAGHKTDPLIDRQIGAATMPVDRYVARFAAGNGAIATKPLIVSGPLTVNASGPVTATVKANGRIVASCRAAGSNGVARPVLCARRLHGVVTLTFRLHHSRLYGFTIKETAT